MKKRSLRLDKEVLTRSGLEGPSGGTTGNLCWMSAGYVFGKLMDALIDCTDSDSCGGGGDASTPAVGCATGSCACETNQDGGPYC